MPTSKPFGPERCSSSTRAERADRPGGFSLAAEHLTALVAALGGGSGEEILAVLERRRTSDPRASELEAILRSEVVPVRRSSW